MAVNIKKIKSDALFLVTIDEIDEAYRLLLRWLPRRGIDKDILKNFKITELVYDKAKFINFIDNIKE